MSTVPVARAPWLFLEPSLGRNLEVLQTKTSKEARQVFETCVPLLLRRPGGEGPEYDENGIAEFLGQEHAQFLYRQLTRRPSLPYVMDASRPWVLYWCLAGLSALGLDVSQYRQGLVETLTPIQNANGGFGGGQYQESHLAPTYAALLSLVTVGGEEAYELIDRKEMWHWLGQLKQPEGDFAMSIGGERDTRAAYCAMVILSLLNLPAELPLEAPARAAGWMTFTDGLAEHISKCQSWDGGIGDVPGAESHGAYTFCALAALSIMGHPSRMLNEFLNVPSLVSWLCQRQHEVEGGLAGRANKLVDGCYNHWIGSCFAIVQAAVANGDTNTTGPNQAPPPQLWNREGLKRYILCCAQEEDGGLRDKPGKPADAYHTLYNLVGLSSTQCAWHPVEDALPENARMYDAVADWQYTIVEQDESIPRLIPMHPVYTVPLGQAERILEHVRGQIGR